MKRFLNLLASTGIAKDAAHAPLEQK